MYSPTNKRTFSRSYLRFNTKISSESLWSSVINFWVFNSLHPLMPLLLKELKFKNVKISLVYTLWRKFYPKTSSKFSLKDRSILIINHAIVSFEGVERVDFTTKSWPRFRFYSYGQKISLLHNLNLTVKWKFQDYNSSKKILSKIVENARRMDNLKENMSFGGRRYR